MHLQKLGTGIARPTRIMLAASGIALLLAGCNTAETLKASETLSHGFVIDQETLDLVPVGSSREQVLLSLGTPSTTATFDTEAFYYISQTRKRAAAFMNPRVVDQRVLAVYFGAIQIKRIRHAMAAALTGDLAGVIGAVLACQLLIGR